MRAFCEERALPSGVTGPWERAPLVLPASDLVIFEYGLLPATVHPDVSAEAGFWVGFIENEGEIKLFLTAKAFF